MTKDELQIEFYRLSGIIRAQVGALNHWRKVYDATQLEARVAEWVRTRIGGNHITPKERAMRLLEEAVELAQAEGISLDLVAKQVAHVYDRPPGEPAQEAAGVAVALYGWCAGRGERLTELALREIERIEAKPLSEITRSLARKIQSNLVTVVAEDTNPRTNQRYR